jgi:spermidine synthase
MRNAAAMTNHAAAPPLAGWRLSVVFASLGAAALITQAALLRQFLVAFGGNELALGLFFAAWFAGITAGAAFGGRLAGSRGVSRAATGATLFAGIFLPPALLVGLKCLPLWLPASPGLAPTWTLIALAGLFCVPFSFWIGLTFPLFAGFVESARGAIGRMFLWEAAGSAFGGLGFAFYLALATPPLGAALWAGAIVAVGLGVAFARHTLGKFCFMAAAAFFALAFAAADRGEQHFERLRFEHLGTGAAFERSIQTPYENLTMARTPEQVQLYGNGAYLDSFPDEYVRRQEAALLLALHPWPRRIALLDGGLTGLAGELLRSPVVERLDLAYLDAALAREIEARLPPDEQARLTDPRRRLVTDDARRFVRRTADRYDLLVVMTADPSTALLNRLFTREFFREARAKLADDGLLVLSATGAANYVGEEIGPYLGSLHATLREVFPQVELFPDDHVWMVASPQAGAVTIDPAALKQHYRDAFAGAPPLPVEVIDLYVVPERIMKVKEALAALPAVINRDLHPVSFMAFLRIWDRFAGGQLAGVLAWLAKTPAAFWWAAMGAAVALLFGRAVAGARAKTIRRYALLSVGSSGFAAMGAIVLVSLAYQSLFGQMYQMAALLFAAYMTGLAVGGGIANAWGESGASPLPRLILGDLAFAAVLVVTLAFLMYAVARPTAIVQAVLFSLLVLSGATAGLAFPLAAQALARLGVGAGRRAGAVDAADHLAAMLGALLVGVVLLPALGTPAILAMLAMLKACSAAGGWVVQHRANL